MHLNLFAQCTPSPQFPGLWKHPGDRTATGYRTLNHWQRLARQLEASCFDALFLADTHGIFDAYQASWQPAVRYGIQVPTVDPTLVAPIVAAATRQLGIAITYSTTYHPPFQCARVFSSLDHLTNGRVAWNVVTSYVPSAEANGLGEHLPHDLRYDRADEYMDVVLALWERSWDSAAVARDAERDMFADPDAVRPIGHAGTFFNVQGPHQCEPSPQRTPVIYQAGASPRGMRFAAKHAEIVFIVATDVATTAARVAELTRLALEEGRPREAFKVMLGSFVMVGRDRGDAAEKRHLFGQLTSHEGELVKWSAWMGLDLAGYPEDTPLAELDTSASRTVVDLLRRRDPERRWTIGDARTFAAMSSLPHRRNGLFGTAEEVADRMEEWIDAGGVDGFNLVPCPPTTRVDDICDLLVPELRERGLFRTEYNPDERTLRQRYFGVEHTRYRAMPGPTTL